GGEVDEPDGVNGIERGFAGSGEPVEVLGAVVDGMEAPEQANAVLKAMAPVDQEVAQQNDFEGLKPPGLRTDRMPQTRWHDGVKPGAEVRQDSEDQAAPEQILADLCPVGWYSHRLCAWANRPGLTGVFHPVVVEMNDVTRILSAIEQGDPHAAEQLLPLV